MKLKVRFHTIKRKYWRWSGYSCERCKNSQTEIERLYQELNWQVINAARRYPVVTGLDMGLPHYAIMADGTKTDNFPVSSTPQTKSVVPQEISSLNIKF